MNGAYELDRLLKEYNGTIKLTQALHAGISKPAFYKYVKEKSLCREAGGVYYAQDTWPDEMYVLHLHCKQAVFSHETALYFHGLTDREPLPWSVTVTTGYNPTALKRKGVRVYTVKKDRHGLGICSMMTNCNHAVPVYNAERTICDILRSRHGLDVQIVADAVKQYVRREDKNIPRLLEYADVFRVKNVLFPYLEVLL